jgi:cell division protein FtsB
MSIWGKLIFWILALGAVFFALQGGEYSTVDLWKQREFKRQLALETDSLTKVVDSLRKEAQLVQTDRATQERIAREQYGMIRGEKEILYRLGEKAEAKPSK